MTAAVGMGPAAQPDITIEDVFDFLHDLPGLPSPRPGGIHGYKQISRQSSVDSVQNGLLAEATRQAIGSLEDGPGFPMHPNSFSDAPAPAPATQVKYLVGAADAWPSEHAPQAAAWANACVAPPSVSPWNGGAHGLGQGVVEGGVGHHGPVPPGGNGRVALLQEAARMHGMTSAAAMGLPPGVPPAGSHAELLQQQAMQYMHAHAGAAAQHARFHQAGLAQGGMGEQARIGQAPPMPGMGATWPAGAHGLVPPHGMATAHGLVPPHCIAGVHWMVPTPGMMLAHQAARCMGGVPGLNGVNHLPAAGAPLALHGAPLQPHVPVNPQMHIPAYPSPAAPNTAGEGPGYLARPMPAGMDAPAHLAAALTAAAGASHNRKLAPPPRKKARSNGRISPAPAANAPAATAIVAVGAPAAAGDRRHLCAWPNCGKAFGSKWGLGRHMRIHTGDKPWACEVPGCEKRFVDRTLLQRHMNTHSDARPFCCPRPGCGKAFKVSKHLEYHLRLHDKPDSFACGIDHCEKFFATPSSLRMHRLLDHGRPEEESAAERQLRTDAQAAADALEQVKQQLAEEQAKVKAATLESRQQRDLAKVQEQLLQALRHEKAQLTEAFQPDSPILIASPLDIDGVDDPLTAKAMADAALAQLIAKSSASSTGSLPVLSGLPSSLVLSSIRADGGDAI